MSEERQAVFYGKVELIPGVICDGYVLDNGTAVMSERGTADLLGMDQKTLNAVRGNWPPKTLKPFISNDFTVRGNSDLETSNQLIGKDFSVATNLVEVTAGNSPHKGRKIVVYTVETIQTLISAYALAFINGVLRENQKHIGKRCATLAVSLIRTALDAAIREACGLPLHIQQTVQSYVVDIVEVARELGLKSSVDGNLVTKKDALDFLGVTKGKLDSHFKKRGSRDKAIALNRLQILATGSKATHMNAYPIEEVVKVSLGMDSVVGIKLKERLFGQIGIFAKPNTAEEIQWQAKLAEVFDGLGFYHNYPLGPYRADFFIGSIKIVLECNGFEHRYYPVEKERERERFITQEYGLVRFDHTVSLEKLINAILLVKPGEIIRLFDTKVTAPRRNQAER